MSASCPCAGSRIRSFRGPGDECCTASRSGRCPKRRRSSRTRGFCARRPGMDWQAGHYVVPRVTLGSALTIEQRHPALGSLHVECRFPLGGLALWGNARTFSFEPFSDESLRPPRSAGRSFTLCGLCPERSATVRCDRGTFWHSNPRYACWHRRENSLKAVVWEWACDGGGRRCSVDCCATRPHRERFGLGLERSCHHTFAVRP